MSQISKKQTIGVVWFVVHCLMFSIISITTKKLLGGGLHVAEILFFQTFSGTLILLPVILLRHRGQIKLTSYKTHISRAFFWALASVLFFYSTTIIPMPKAIAISFAVPLFTTIMAVVFLKEELHRHRTLSLIVGFIGMLIIIQPGFEAFEPASMLVVAASFCWSLTDIMIKTLSKSHHAFVNTFYFALFSALCTLPFAIIFWRLPSASEFAMLAFLGSLFVFNIYSVTKAYENAELTIMMPFAFTQLIFIAILSYIVFGEVMTMTTAIGSMIIIGSTSYIAYREKKRHNLALKTPHHDI